MLLCMCVVLFLYALHLNLFSCLNWFSLFFFFFQAEDGIRDHCVTGVRRVLFRSFPASSIVGSPVLRLVLGSVLAGAGQIRSMPVPLLLAVAVESGPTGVGDGDAAGVVAVAGDPEGLAFCATADAVAKTAKQRTETRTPYLTNFLFESICFSWSGKAWSSVGQHASSCSA